MDMNWLPQNGRPHLRSRGVVNGLNLCYQSPILQAFMHQAPFLSWIRQHNLTAAACVATPCLQCYLKQLAQDYWSSNGNTPVQQDPNVRGIAQSSYLSWIFQQNQQDDANLFYNWVVDTLREHSK